MTRFQILASAFVLAYEKEEKRALTDLLGCSQRELVESALKQADFSAARETNSSHNPKVVVSTAACGLSKEDWQNWLASGKRALQDCYGNVIGLLSEEEPGNESFEQWTEKQDLQLEKEDTFALSFPGVLDMASLAQVLRLLRLRINKHWMEEGVRLDDPERIEISPFAKIGKFSYLEGDVKVLGETVLGDEVFVSHGSVIKDSEIGPRCRIYSSLIESSTMEEGADIGPYSHLRPQAHLGKGVHIGNFVEVKKASLGQGTKAGHLAYIGDADVGSNVNISCGVIFCNYDGKKKHRTTVGNDAFLGSNANLVAPVTVEDEGFVAAGSTITKKVEEGALAVERSEQKTISGYVKRKKDAGLL